MLQFNKGGQGCPLLAAKQINLSVRYDPAADATARVDMNTFPRLTPVWHLVLRSYWDETRS